MGIRKTCITLFCICLAALSFLWVGNVSGEDAQNPACEPISQSSFELRQREVDFRPVMQYRSDGFHVDSLRFPYAAFVYHDTAYVANIVNKSYLPNVSSYSYEQFKNTEGVRAVLDVSLLPSQLLQLTGRNRVCQMDLNSNEWILSHKFNDAEPLYVYRKMGIWAEGNDIQLYKIGNKKRELVDSKSVVSGEGTAFRMRWGKWYAVLKLVGTELWAIVADLDNGEISKFICASGLSTTLENAKWSSGRFPKKYKHYNTPLGGEASILVFPGDDLVCAILNESGLRVGIKHGTSSRTLACIGQFDDQLCFAEYEAKNSRTFRAKIHVFELTDAQLSPVVRRVVHAENGRSIQFAEVINKGIVVVWYDMIEEKKVKRSCTFVNLRDNEETKYAEGPMFMCKDNSLNVYWAFSDCKSQRAYFRLETVEQPSIEKNGKEEPDAAHIGSSLVTWYSVNIDDIKWANWAAK